MKTLEAAKCTTQEIQSLLVGAIAPRPIAFVSTASAAGTFNLAPFSFFNAFGSDPPIVAFSPARKGRNGELKDTYRNLVATRECVINIVTLEIVEQMNLASAEYPPEVCEFDKAGFTPLRSQFVKPPRVKESPIHLECILYDMIELGNKPGSGNLAICQIVCFHLDEKILNNQGKIDPLKVGQVARNGASYYTHAKPENMFELPAPKNNLSVGFEAIPHKIKSSSMLTGNLLARLASINSIPVFAPGDPEFQGLSNFREVEEKLQRLLTQYKIEEAWMLILFAQKQGLL